MVRKLRKATALAVVTVMAVATTALAVANYTFARPKVVGGTSQTTWTNGVPQVGVTIDKRADPRKTWMHALYLSDANLAGAFSSDKNCSNKGNCLANWYTRSSNAGRAWSNPVKVPGPGGHVERGTLAVTGATVVVAMMSQEGYWGGCCSTFDTSDPRRVYVSRSTNHGASWSNAVVLPGQTNSSRGDYIYIAASGANVHVVTTNTQNGQVWYWRSTNRGKSFTGPVTLGTTTNQDNASGYVGGYSALPSIAAAGGDVVAAWTNTAAGQVVARASTDGGATWGAQTQLAASGGNANNGYTQAAGRDTRIAVTWTTASGAFLRIYNTTTNSWGVTRTIVTFPNSVGGTSYVGGEGATVTLGPGGVVGVALSQCISAGGSICNDASLGLQSTRESLIWRASSDGGASWSSPTVLAAYSDSVKNRFINNYATATFFKQRPWVMWNGHDSNYTDYVVRYRLGSPS